MTFREIIEWGKANDPHAPLILVYGLVVGLCLAVCIWIALLGGLWVLFWRTV